MKSLLLAIALVSVGTLAEAADFYGISGSRIHGAEPGSMLSNWSPKVNVTSISGDGSTIAGSTQMLGINFDCASQDCSSSGFVWAYEAEQGYSLGRLPETDYPFANPKRVEALSYDGSTALVSYEHSFGYASGLVHGETITPLRSSTPTDEWLNGFAMSADGSKVVGTSSTGPRMWTAEQGMVALPSIESAPATRPSAISSDGSTILLNNWNTYAGGAITAAGFGTAVRFTPDGELFELPADNAAGTSRVAASSFDGSVVVGSWTPVMTMDGWFKSHATKWVNGEPISLEMGGSSVALDVSADGETIVGTLDFSDPLTDAYFEPIAMLWANGKSYELETMLRDKYGLGSKLDGWKLTSATAISDDGRVIAGNGIDPAGNQSAWVAVLRVPEPASAMLLVVVGCLVLAMARVRAAKPANAL
ncbi:hypothetical protein [Aeoliella mucimassa]|uniref:PEP-CTERM protein-sorting domain-containing protein n=1 Tax=Aeoliella mucimassa TaxID=2527972 RepID=A0A518AMP1_9BACT|nr:hypothetical protein [Aeoliella mucimassa]QDU55997.1 hypothetical protein Pan181_21990 [Aeoliella mucimassa]